MKIIIIPLNTKMDQHQRIIQMEIGGEKNGPVEIGFMKNTISTMLVVNPTLSIWIL